MPFVARTTSRSRVWHSCKTSSMNESYMTTWWGSAPEPPAAPLAILSRLGLNTLAALPSVFGVSPTSVLTDTERWRRLAAASLLGVVPRLRRLVLASAFSKLGALGTASASPPNKCVHGLT